MHVIENAVLDLALVKWDTHEWISQQDSRKDVMILKQELQACDFNADHFRDQASGVTVPARHSRGNAPRLYQQMCLHK